MSVVHNKPESSENSQTEKCVGCDDEKCTECNTENSDQLFGALLAAIGKIDFLTKRVKSLETKMNKVKNNSSDFETSNKSGRPSKYNSKASNMNKNRVEFKKGRNFKATQDEESGNSRSMESQSEATSEFESDQESSSRKQKKVSKRSTFSKQREAVSESSTASESDSSEVRRSCRHKRRRRVKSGAQVKKRPVLQTELWPHTIANEDGEDVTSEDIGLEKFLSCFTFIMKTSKGDEVSGRSELLHAISSVLECLPCSEARTFHNVTMTKIEQRRINWKTKFIILADKFIEKKVRMTLTSQVLLSGNGAPHTGNSTYRNVEKSFDSCPSKSQAENNLCLNSIVCKQFNFSFCSYGHRCKRWHVCWACAEKGKMGEPHTASSHGKSDSSGMQSQDEQRL